MNTGADTSGRQLTCHHVDAMVDIYFADATNMLFSAEKLQDSISAYCDDLSQIEGVDGDYNPCATLSVTRLDTDTDEGTPAPSQTQPTSAVSPGGVSAIATASMILIIIIIVFARSRQESQQRRHHDLARYDDRIYLKQDFDGIETFATTADNSANLQGYLYGDETESQSAMSGWSGDSASQTAGPSLRQFDNDPLAAAQTICHDERHISMDDTEHLCSSPTCEACEQKRTTGLQFRPVTMPGYGSGPLRNATRDHREDNTVQL